MSCSTPRDPYKPLTADELSRTLTQRLVPVVDRLRAVGVRLGTRTYEVRIIRTAWTGEYRGEGVEYVVADYPLTPTPLVDGLDGIQQSTQDVGQIEQGTVRVSEISGRYSADFLRGWGVDSQPPAQNEQVYYEVRYPTPDGDGVRRRFVLRAGPAYFADRAEWQMSLEKQIEDRAPERF